MTWSHTFKRVMAAHILNATGRSHRFTAQDDENWAIAIFIVGLIILVWWIL